jgi:hypothetical protein
MTLRALSQCSSHSFTYILLNSSYSSTMPAHVTQLDLQHVADSVYALASPGSSSPIAPQVREALGVIETALDTHG